MKALEIDKKSSDRFSNFPQADVEKYLKNILYH